MNLRIRNINRMILLNALLEKNQILILHKLIDVDKHIDIPSLAYYNIITTNINDL